MRRDLRQYARQTNIRLLVGFVALLFIVGDGLIYLFYGRQAALMGLICMLGAVFPALLIIGALWVIEWISRRNNQG